MFICLSDKEMQRCIDFSRECAKNQQEIEFGQHDTAPRPKSEVYRDNLIGKIAEVAFSKMLEEVFKVHTELDFNYYPRGVWDEQDAVINGWRIDIKATRRGGRWMLIEWNKLCFRMRQNMLSHLYVMASVDWDRRNDTPLPRVELVGCASIEKLRNGVHTTQILRKGEYIPETQTRLQADNFAISFSDLEREWETVIPYILSHSPPNTDNFPNPYTGMSKQHIQRQSAPSEICQPVEVTPIPSSDTVKISLIRQIKLWLKDFVKGLKKNG